MGHGGVDPLEALRAYARQLSDEAESVPLARLQPASQLPSRSQWPSRVLAVVAIVAALALPGPILIQQVNAAVPGDRLYGIDLFFERVADRLGVSSNHTVERMEETMTLAARSDVAGAMNAVRSGARDSMSEVWSGDLQKALLTIDSADLNTLDLAEKLWKLAHAVATEEDVAEAIAGIVRTVPVAAGHGDLPPGQDPDFVPPGQDPWFTTPGQSDSVLPPGQDPGFVTPGSDQEATDEAGSTGRGPKANPPGQAEKDLAPSRGNDRGRP